MYRSVDERIEGELDGFIEDVEAGLAEAGVSVAEWVASLIRSRFEARLEDMANMAKEMLEDAASENYECGKADGYDEGYEEGEQAAVEGSVN